MFNVTRTAVSLALLEIDGVLVEDLASLDFSFENQKFRIPIITNIWPKDGESKHEVDVNKQFVFFRDRNLSACNHPNLEKQIIALIERNRLLARECIVCGKPDVRIMKKKVPLPGIVEEFVFECSGCNSLYELTYATSLLRK